jgi:predicted nucleic acid-binding protein
MTGFVVDASVAIKWLIDEPLSGQAVRLLDADVPLVAPELIYAEAANAIWAIARRGQIDTAEVHEALDLLADAPLTVPSSMRQRMAATARLANDLAHPVYDCLYLALALQEERPFHHGRPTLPWRSATPPISGQACGRARKPPLIV